MKKRTVSVILMVFNEAETIEKEVVNYYKSIVKKIPGSELIVAEDGSRDATREILFKLTRKYPIKLVVSAKKIGYSVSLRKAVEKSKCDLVFYADAGGKHDPNDFWKLYEKIENYDFITGYKKIRHDPWYRLFLAWWLNILVNLYFWVSFKDIDCGYKLFNSKVKKTLLLKPWILPNNISLEITLRAIGSGLKTTEVPIIHNARMHGPSRGLPLKKIPKAIIKILKYFPRLKKEIFC